MARYASNTTVDADQSINQIRNLLRRAGAAEIAVHERAQGSAVMFKLTDDGLKTDLPITLRVDWPDERDEAICLTPTGKVRKGESLRKEIEKEYRRRWRCIFLLVKSKIVAIEEGGTTVRKEFLYDIMLRNGVTMGTLIDEQLTRAIETGKFERPLLEGGHS